MSKMRDVRRMPVTCEVEAGEPVWYVSAACDKCGYIGKRRVSNKHLPPEVVANHFRKAGWRIGQKVVCAKCVLAEHAGEAPANDDSAPHPQPQPEVPMAETCHAEPPRAPTKPELRRVRDALLDAYDEERERYFADGSDVALAAKLDVPRAWVIDLREALALGPDTNEKAAAHDDEMAAINAELSGMSDDFLRRFGMLETRVRKLEVERGARRL